MSGRAFLQIPGPSKVPEWVPRAMDRPVIYHRGPDFGGLVRGHLPMVEERLRSDRGTPPYKAVPVVHDETSTGVASDIGSVDDPAPRMTVRSERVAAR